MGKAFRAGETLLYLDNFICCRADGTLGFDESFCGLETQEPTALPTRQPTTAVPTSSPSQDSTEVRDADTKSGSEKTIIIGVLGFCAIFVSIGVAVILLLRAQNRLKLLQRTHLVV